MQWKDSKGTPWNNRLTIADAKRLKASGFDLADPKSFQAMFADPLTVIEIIAEAMRPQWEKAGLSYEEFAEILTEDVGRLVAVQKCFVEGLADFFRRLGDDAMAIVVEKAEKAASLSKEASKARASGARVDQLIAKAMEKEESDFQKRIDAEEAKLSGPTSTSDAELLASQAIAGLTES